MVCLLPTYRQHLHTYIHTSRGVIDLTRTAGLGSELDPTCCEFFFCSYRYSILESVEASCIPSNFLNCSHFSLFYFRRFPSPRFNSFLLHRRSSAGVRLRKILVTLISLLPNPLATSRRTDILIRYLAGNKATIEEDHVIDMSVRDLVLQVCKSASLQVFHLET